MTPVRMQHFRDAGLHGCSVAVLGLGPGSELADPRERKYGVGAPFSCSAALSLLQPGPLEGLLSPGPSGGGLPLSYSSTRGTQWKRKCRLSPPSVILFFAGV